MIDQLSKSSINSIIELSKEYDRIHDEMTNLSNTISALSQKQSAIHNQLKECRYREISLINKIEKDSGIKITPDMLKIILDEKHKG